MCLYKGHVFPKLAQSDIVVYKKLIKIKQRSKTIYNTPFIKTKVKIGETIKCSIPAIFGIFTKQIEGSGVHSYSSERIAAQKLGDNHVIVKSIIPKGSLYYMSDDETEIASSKLILEEELDIKPIFYIPCVHKRKVQGQKKKCKRKKKMRR